MYACNGMMHLCQATGRWPTEMIEYADVVQVCLASELWRGEVAGDEDDLWKAIGVSRI